LGVNLEAFYKLLWRHVLVVEILKEKFQITTEEKQRSFLDSLWRRVTKSKRREKALAYLREWGEDFWKDTEYRVKDITTKLERDLTGDIGAKIPEVASFSLSTAKHLSEEQRAEIVHSAQDIVNRVQIRELTDVIDLLGDLLAEDPDQRYYFTIDRLDDDWVEEGLRFRLIRALIETSLGFARVRNLKVIVAIRSDLLDRVFRHARHPDFQEEKYRTCSLDIGWSRQTLIEVLDKRIDFLVRHQYTRRKVTHSDVLPSGRVGKLAAIDYMLDRTLLRPRDIIEFFNACIRQANGQATISTRALNEAEGIYARERLRALADEWGGVYAHLFQLSTVLRNKGRFFKLGDLPLNELTDVAMNVVLSGEKEYGADYKLMRDVVEYNVSAEDYRKDIVLIFYKVGLVGLKLDKLTAVSWSHISGVSISRAEVDSDTRVYIHPMFWRVLGVSERDGGDDSEL